MIDKNGFLQDQIDALFREVADRIGQTYFDEAAIVYEAARLDRNEVVLIFYFENVDYEKGDFSNSRANVVVAKGGEEVKQYLRGESSTLEFEAVLATDLTAASALNAALKRRNDGIRLVSKA